MHAMANGAGRGVADIVRESALKIDSEEKNPLNHRGPVGPIFYQLSYIPTHD